MPDHNLQNRVRLLLVEDDEGDAFLTRKALSECFRPAFDVTLVKTLAAAVENLGQEPQDVVLLDLTLPDSVGLETLARVVSQFPAIPVVVLTGLESTELGLQAVREGAQEYINKSWLDSELLGREISHAIERSRLKGAVQSQLEATRVLERRFRRLIEENVDGIVILDDTKTVRFVNPAAAGLLGAESEALVGTELKIGDCEDGVVLVELGEKREEREAWGEVRSVETVWEGAPARMISIRDVTSRVKTERELTLYRERLKDMVDEKTAGLRQAIDRLEKQDEAKTQFVFNVSHDLKTPLTSMMYALDNLTEGAVGDISESVLEYLSLIREDCKRLSSTVTDILDLSAVEAGRMELSSRLVSLSNLVNRVGRQMLPAARRKKIDLQLQADKEPLFVDGDPVKLERIVMNILQNAINYTDDGGHVEVLVAPDEDDANMLCMRCLDDGVGIDPYHIDRVTERYYRVGSHVKGTGLGLALVKEMVKLHSGELKLFSPPRGREHGTEVVVRLPFCPAPRVAVVDDDPGSQRALAEQLENWCFVPELLTFTPGLAGTLQEAPPELMLVDLDGSNAGGIELISTLKGNATLKSVPMVAMCKETPDSVKQEILDAFSVPSIIRPFDLPALAACLD